VFHISIWEVGALGGLSPPKPPRGDGTATALDTGRQRQNKAYVATSEWSVRMPIMLLVQK